MIELPNIDTLIERLLLKLAQYDPISAAHSRRVGVLAVKLAKKMGASENELEIVHQGALLHDIGKLSIPLPLLNKESRLTAEEWAKIQTHPEKGIQILAQGDFPSTVREIVHCHHEHWVGTGYPRGLTSTEIPLMARIVSVADGYDTGTSDRPYAKALPQNKVLKIIQGMSGEIFDPTVVATLVELCEEGF